MIRYIIVVIVITIGIFPTLADLPVITGVTAQQRYPWNGKIDISYTITGDIAEEAMRKGVLPSLEVIAIDIDSNITNVATQLSGDMTLTEGLHQIVWDMETDGLTLKSSNIVFRVSCVATPATYCVIDLSAGKNASEYPITYLDAPPTEGFNTTTYKTSKLVLRRIEPGAFKMCNSCDVTLTKPFYIGVFEMTQKQYILVNGSQPSGSSVGDMLPVPSVSYNELRGSFSGSQWPDSSNVDESSFLGLLRNRTGLDFDLPTEAQWEFACRAGTTSDYNNGGNSASDLQTLGRYSGNTPEGYNLINVGSYNPNAWGLYDMHGNVCELCLDWFAKLSNNATDPVGPTSGSERVVRGGGYRDNASACKSSYRSSIAPNIQGGLWQGFRIARTLPSNACIAHSGESAATTIDLTSGTRTASLTEHIRYSTYWVDGAATDSIAVVEVDGEKLSSKSSVGVVEWTPTRNGSFTLTHKVMAGDVQVGDTLTAIFNVVGLDTPFANGAVMVPYDWLVQYVEKYGGGDFEVAGNATGENGYTIWQSYVAGLDPESENSKLIAYIEMQDDGTAKITWCPDLRDDAVPRKYTIMGAAQLPATASDWVPVTDENKESMRFFKVLVTL